LQAGSLVGIGEAKAPSAAARVVIAASLELFPTQGLRFGFGLRVGLGLFVGIPIGLGLGFGLVGIPIGLGLGFVVWLVVWFVVWFVVGVGFVVTLIGGAHRVVVPIRPVGLALRIVPARFSRLDDIVHRRKDDTCRARDNERRHQD
jgi:hypothetical protein